MTNAHHDPDRAAFVLAILRSEGPQTSRVLARLTHIAPAAVVADLLHLEACGEVRCADNKVWSARHATGEGGKLIAELHRLDDGEAIRRDLEAWLRVRVGRRVQVSYIPAGFSAPTYDDMMREAWGQLAEVAS